MDRGDLKEIFEELEELIEGYEDEDELDRDDLIKIEDDIDYYRSQFAEILEGDDIKDEEQEFAEECMEEIKNIEYAIKDENLSKYIKGLKKLYNIVKNEYNNRD